MTLHTPPRTANSVMSAYPGGVSGQKVVLLATGNYPSYSNYLNETFTFSGTDWTNQSASLIDPLGPLPGRTNAVMAYDVADVMLFGGQGGSAASGVLGDTWRYNGLTWVAQSPTVSPFGRYKAAAAYLSGTGVVMFGGENLLYKTLETWIWSGSAWSNVTAANGLNPLARTDHMMAASSTTVLMFGGETTGASLNDTWFYTSAGGWVKQNPTVSPSVRSDACMAYDSTNSIWVMFGGKNAYGYLNETWTYSTVSGWSQVSVPAGTGPSGRIGSQMCFDTTSAKTVMFGGISATSNYPSNETWVFSGSSLTWSQL